MCVACSISAIRLCIPGGARALPFRIRRFRGCRPLRRSSSSAARTPPKRSIVSVSPRHMSGQPAVALGYMGRRPWQAARHAARDPSSRSRTSSRGMANTALRRSRRLKRLGLPPRGKHYRPFGPRARRRSRTRRARFSCDRARRARDARTLVDLRDAGPQEARQLEQPYTGRDRERRERVPQGVRRSMLKSGGLDSEIPMTASPARKIKMTASAPAREQQPRVESRRDLVERSRSRDGEGIRAATRFACRTA